MKKQLAFTLITTMLFGNVAAKSEQQQTKPHKELAYVKLAAGAIIGFFGGREIIAVSCLCPCALCLGDECCVPCCKIVWGTILLFPASLCIKSGMEDLETLEKIKKHKKRAKKTCKEHKHLLQAKSDDV